MAVTDKDISAIKDDFGNIQSGRSTWEGQAQDIIRYMMPMRSDIMSPEWETPGRDKMTYIQVSHATHAGELMAAGIASRMVNASIDWYQLKTEHPEIEKLAEVKQWLDAVQNKFDYVFRKSNFYSTYHEGLKDKCFLGSACIFIGYHPTMKVYFESLNLGECYPSINEYGIVDKMYRKMMMSVRNLAAKFGPDKLSDKTRVLFEKGGSSLEEKFPVLHSVRPRRLRDIKAKDQKNKPWEDVYFEMETDHVLREGGYDEFPFIFSRYDSPAGQVMGRGPGWTALPAVMQLQQMESDRMTADQRALAPAYLLPSSLRGPMIDLTPNGITFIDETENIQSRIGAFPTSNQLAIVGADIKAKQEEISMIFYADLMLLAMDPRMTATQFQQMAQEKMMLLGPFVFREQCECLNPVFKRMFNVLWDAGQLPLPPPVLMEAGGRLRIDYVSSLALAQKAAANQGIISTLGFVTQAAQVDPHVVNRFNLDAAVQEVAQNNGCPQNIIRSDEEVAQITQQQAEAAAQQKQEQQMMEAAKIAAPHMHKGPEKGSPMEQLQGMLQQGAGNA